MRLSILPALLALTLAAACQLSLPGQKADAPPAPEAAAGVAPEAIEVTPLGGAGVEEAAAGAAVPGPAAEAPAADGPKMTAEELAAQAPETPPDTEELLEELVVPEVPQELKSPSQIACEKKGGRYAKAGNSSTFVCVRETGQGGKRCSKESDCKGVCLARSRTCSPITPVLGCQDILTDSGTRVTECVQ